jgi:hypothetical protein
MKQAELAPTLMALSLMGCATAIHWGASDVRGEWFPRILMEDCSNEHFLPDWSYVGYRWGEKAIPELKPNLNAVAFGAVPDDGMDDTEAILKAVAVAHEKSGPVVLHLPKGRFILRDVIWIERSDFVLQGAGSGKDGTVIEMPDHLGKMNLEREAELFRRQKEFNDATGRGKFSPFSWMGGIIWVRHPDAPYIGWSKRESEHVQADVLAGKRGEHTVTVNSADGLEVGQPCRLMLYNTPDDSLLKHIHEAENIEFGSWLKTVGMHTDLTIAAIDNNQVTFKEFLLHDVRPEWRGAVYPVNVLGEVGIEHLRIEFPNRTEYGGHYREEGYNAITLGGLRHGWVRDVVIDNADTAIRVGLCSNVTLTDCRFTDRIGSHYAIQYAMSCRCLVRDFTADTKSIHTISFNTGARGSVFTHGRCVKPRFDQHCVANHQNLFDDIEAVEAESGFSMFVHGGGREFFPLCGAFNTFWNIRADFADPGDGKTPLVVMGSSLPGPQSRLVGLTGNAPIALERFNPQPYIEGLNRPGIAVPSLYEYQLARRLGR